MTEAVPAPGLNMGQPIPRYEARLKVTGSAQYASDFAAANPVHAFMVTSSVARGQITGFDDVDARRVLGVLDIMTYQNRPPLKVVTQPADGIHALERVPGLNGPEVSYEGEIVAMVLAETYESAREAAHRMVVHYQRNVPISGFETKGLQTQDIKEIFPERKSPSLGDVAKALATSVTVVEANYSTPPEHHVALELYSSIVEWRGEDLTVHESSQAVYALKNTLAETLGVAPARVNIVSKFIGGGFGGKAAMTRRTALAALAARQLGRPVKIVLTRDQGFSLGHRPESRHSVRLGATREGRLTGYSHDLLEITSRNDPFVAPGGIDDNAAMYKFTAVGSTRRLARADRSPPMAMRAPSEVGQMFALESAMDELAIALAIDPVELRRRNDTDRDMVTGKLFTSRSLMRCFDEAATVFGWSKRDPRPRSMHDGDWLVGWGCASASYTTAMTNAVARVQLSADGAAVVQTSASDLGTGAYTVFGQEVALRLGIPAQRVAVELGESRLPPGPIAGGSSGSATGCSAIAIACDHILDRLGISAGADDRLRQAAFERLGVGVVEAQGDYVPTGVPSPSTASAYKGSPAFIGGTHTAKAQYAFGAQFVEVRVHRRTHEIRVPRMVGAFAAGRILNPRLARSQLMGGMIWGMSSALLEATEIDSREARYTNDNLAEYLIPVNADVRQLDVLLVPEVDHECNPAGVKGVGEIGGVGTAAAIANAVYHATGQRIRDLPITIDKLTRI